MVDLRTLREGLRQLSAANNGQQPDGQTVARAATVLGSVPLVVELGDHRRVPRLVAPAGADADTQSIAAVRMRPHLPWLFLFAAGFLIAAVFSANLIGDGLRDTLNSSSSPGPTRVITTLRIPGGRSVSTADISAPSTPPREDIGS